MHGLQAPLRLLPLVALLSASAVLAGCNSPDGDADDAPAQDPCAGATRDGLALQDANHTVVALSTSHGCVLAELYDDQAPITVANFKAYVEEGFYADLIFHRIIAGFMSQTGGFTAPGSQKQPTHDPIHNEAVDSGLLNLKYTLAMARTGRLDPQSPHSATSQFFINADDNAFLNPTGSEDDPDRAGYAVFGIVVSGRDVADAINAAPVHPCPTGEASCPDAPEPKLLSARVVP